MNSSNLFFGNFASSGQSQHSSGNHESPLDSTLNNLFSAENAQRLNYMNIPAATENDPDGFLFYGLTEFPSVTQPPELAPSYELVRSVLDDPFSFDDIEMVLEGGTWTAVSVINQSRSTY
ncbi:hypothetical protein HWV62_1320 [Athelia sp. TMB]|nr:hypothetical protein HWV62_1320 [Athelia sp. TMB]